MYRVPRPRRTTGSGTPNRTRNYRAIVALAAFLSILTVVWLHARNSGNTLTSLTGNELQNNGGGGGGGAKGTTTTDATANKQTGLGKPNNKNRKPSSGGSGGYQQKDSLNGDASSQARPGSDSEDHEKKSEDSPREEGEKPISFTMSMNAEMKAAWPVKSERLTYPITITGLGQDELSTMRGTSTFYGKSSLKIKYTKRRSVHIQLEKPIKITDDAPMIKNFLLLSLWEDKYRIAYRSSAKVLKDLGLFFAYSRLVEFNCEASNEVCKGGTLGAYLLLEYPSDAIARHLQEEAQRAKNGELEQRRCESAESFATRKAVLSEAAATISSKNGGVAVGTRNWFYFEKPAIYDILHVPSYKRNSTLSPLYRKVEGDPESYLSQASESVFDMTAYMSWLAINTLLQNGDYDDEVFFYQLGSRKKFMGIMAWDYDSVLSSCHRNGKNAIRTELMFCAETPLEKKILKSEVMKSQYMSALQCTIKYLRTGWPKAVQGSVAELQAIIGTDGSGKTIKATFDDSKSCCPDVVKGGKELITAVAKRIKKQEGVLPAQQGSDSSTENSESGNSGDANSSDGESNASNQEPAVGNDNNGVKNDEATCTSAAAESDLRIKINKVLSSVIENEYKGGGTGHFKKLMTQTDFQVQRFLLATPSGRQFTDPSKDRDLNDPGLYCLSFTAVQFSAGVKGNAECRLPISRPFVVRSKERGKAEFAVRHYDKPSIAEFFGQQTTPIIPKYNDDKSDSGHEQLHATVITPYQWLRGSVFTRVFPAVIRITTVNGGYWVRKNFVATNNKHEAASSDSHRGASIIRGFSAMWMVHAMPRKSVRDRGEKWETQAEKNPAGPFVVRHDPVEEINEQNEFVLRIRGGRTPKEDILAEIPRPKLLKTMTYDDVSIPSRVETDAILRGKTAEELQEAAKQQERERKVKQKNDGGGAAEEDTNKPDEMAIDREIEAEDCTVVVSDVITVLESATLTIEPGCTILMRPEAGFQSKGTIHFKGTQEKPITIMPDGIETYSEKEPRFVDEKSRWDTIHLRSHTGLLKMEYTFVMGSGSKATDKSTGEHHKRSASVTVVQHAKAEIKNSFFLDLAGPAIAAGKEGNVRIEDSLVQWAEMGAECVGCTFTSVGTVWTHFPSWTSEYADEDNDGLYLSGGRHRVLHSVIAHTKDDGIDSGTPEKSSGNGGSLLVDHSIIEMVAHEGVALSSSPKGVRQAKIANSVIHEAQQGIESGYAGPKHEAVVEDVSISNTRIALRYGDNYRRKEQDGKLSVKRTTVFNSDVPALNYLRYKRGPQASSFFDISESMFSTNSRSSDDDSQQNGAQRGVCKDLYPQGVNMDDSRSITEREAQTLENKLLDKYRFS